MKQETIELIAALLEVIPSDRNVGVNTTVDDTGESISIYISPAEKASVELSPLEKPEGWVPIKLDDAKNHLGKRCRFRFNDITYTGVITMQPSGSVVASNVTEKGTGGSALDFVILEKPDYLGYKKVSDLQIKV